MMNNHSIYVRNSIQSVKSQYDDSESPFSQSNHQNHSLVSHLNQTDINDNDSVNYNCFDESQLLMDNDHQNISFYTSSSSHRQSTQYNGLNHYIDSSINIYNNSLLGNDSQDRDYIHPINPTNSNFELDQGFLPSISHQSNDSHSLSNSISSQFYQADTLIDPYSLPPLKIFPQSITNSYPFARQAFKNLNYRKEDCVKSNAKKTYDCDFPGCNRVFPRLYNLKSHQLCHTGNQ